MGRYWLHTSRVSIPSRDFFPSDVQGLRTTLLLQRTFQSLPGISFLLKRHQNWKWGMVRSWVSIPSRDFFPSDSSLQGSCPDISFIVSIPSRDFFPSDNQQDIVLFRLFFTGFNPFQGFLSFWLTMEALASGRYKMVSIPSRDFFPSDDRS